MLDNCVTVFVLVISTFSPYVFAHEDGLLHFSLSSYILKSWTPTYVCLLWVNPLIVGRGFCWVDSCRNRLEDSQRVNYFLFPQVHYGLPHSLFLRLVFCHILVYSLYIPGQFLPIVCVACSPWDSCMLHLRNDKLYVYHECMFFAFVNVFLFLCIYFKLYWCTFYEYELDNLAWRTACLRFFFMPAWDTHSIFCCCHCFLAHFGSKNESMFWTGGHPSIVRL